MPKARTGELSGRPPAPGADHAVIEEWWHHDVMPTVQPLVAAVDGLIRAVVPDLRYAVKWGKAHYGRSDLGWVIEVAAYHKSVNVVFFGGVDLDPPPPLGSTGRTRYVKLHRLDEAEDPQLRSWVEQAGRTPGWGWTAPGSAP
jgi:hypothetical protein